MPLYDEMATLILPSPKYLDGVEYQAGWLSAHATVEDYGLCFASTFLRSKVASVDAMTAPAVLSYWHGYLGYIGYYIWR